MAPESVNLNVETLTGPYRTLGFSLHAHAKVGDIINFEIAKLPPRHAVIQTIDRSRMFTEVEAKELP